ncbi:MAG: bifunctional sugar-1-phosphate nucleotidylyltransferase/acetyltransferase [Candidatus Woesearchaeota archaeon]
MKAVILCAGKSTRTYPFTISKPKALLPILDKTLIEVSIESLKGIAEEVIIVVGCLKEQIIEHLGSTYQGIKITYVEQKEQLGTGHALMQARSQLTGKFLVLNGDDIYSPKDILNCAKHDRCLLGKEVEDPEKWGILLTEGKALKGIQEKPTEPLSNIGNTGLYVLDKNIFPYLEKTGKSERGEIEITSAISEMCKEQTYMVEKIQDYWLPVSYPWQLLEANAFFLEKISQSNIKGIVEAHVTMRGVVVLREKSIIKSGCYLEGPVWIGKDCVVGPNAYLRKDTILLDNVRTRSEIVDSLIMKGTTAKHHSYIGHSIVGENCNIGAGTITSDYRHDGATNKTIIQGKKVDSNRRKLGAFIGDGVHTGINTSIYPGRKIWPGKTTVPGEIVKEDIM